MEPIRFRRWNLLSDPVATRHAYASLEIGWPEFCGCVHCKNYIRGRAATYPEEALRLFETLGIDPRREQQVIPYRPRGRADYQYGGCFSFVGTLVSGPDFWKIESDGRVSSDPQAFDAINDRFGIGFTTRLSRRPTVFQAQPVVQVEFLATVPWVLERRMPEGPD